MRYDLSNSEVEIDLADFFKRALKRWRLGLAFVLGCALIGALAAFLLYEWRSAHPEAYSPEALEAARQALSAEECDEVDRVYAQDRTYFLIGESLNERMGSSLLMSLDPETALVKSRSYLLSDRQQQLLSALKAGLFSREDRERLAEAAGAPDQADHIEELITMTDLTLETGQEITANGVPEAGEGAIFPESGSVRPKVASLITFTALGADEAFCDRLLSLAEEMLFREVEKLEPGDPRASVSFFEEDLIRDSKNEILSRQLQLNSSLTSVVTDRKKYTTDLIDKLNSAQKKLLRQLQLRDGVAEVVPRATEGRGLGRSAAFGGLLGLLLFFAVLFVPYVFGGRIRTPEELQRATGIRLLGQFGKAPEKDPEKKGTEVLGRLVARELEAWDRQPVLMPAGDSGEGEAFRKGSGFFLAFEGGFDRENRFSEALGRELKGVELSFGAPLTSEEAMASMLAGKGVLLGVKLDDSRRDELFSLCRMAADHHLPILGYIVEA